MRRLWILPIVIVALVFQTFFGTVPISANNVTAIQVEQAIMNAERNVRLLRPFYNITSEEAIAITPELNTIYAAAVVATNQARQDFDRLGASVRKEQLRPRLLNVEDERMRTAHYIDAVRQGNILEERVANFEEVLELGDISQINRLYDEYTAQLRRVEMHTSRAYGPVNRTFLRERFVTPGKVAYERTIYEVSVYRLINQINVLLSNGQLAAANEELAKLGRLNRRAQEIKEAGGYEPIPQQIYTQLASLEHNARVRYEELRDGKVIEAGRVLEAVVTTSSLNIRQAPTTSSQVVGQVTYGNKVVIESVSGEWAQVLFGSVRGFVHSNFLSIGTLNETGEVISSVLNVRAKATTESDLVGQVRMGDRVKIHHIEGEWAFMTFNNLIGFININFLSLQVNPSPKGLNGKVIVIDPGHGGRDPGAVANGIRESDLVLEVGLLVQQKLDEVGAKVIMTRSTDIFIELIDRSTIANNANADIFVSIHANAAGSTAAHGTETYWNRTHQSPESKALAEKIQFRLIQLLQTNNRGVKEGNFSVIRNTTMPSVLVELGFVTNATEANRMKTTQFKNLAAEAIYLGILDYYYQ